jgi:hypothetical protein
MLLAQRTPGSFSGQHQSKLYFFFPGHPTLQEKRIHCETAIVCEWQPGAGGNIAIDYGEDAFMPATARMRKCVPTGDCIAPPSSLASPTESTERDGPALQRKQGHEENALLLRESYRAWIEGAKDNA